MPLWLWLWLAVPVLGGVLAWMILSGWWVHGDARCYRKTQQNYEKEKHDGEAQDEAEGALPRGEQGGEG